MTERFDFRFNYYIPESDRNLIDSQSTTARSERTTFEAPYATGHRILQDVTTTTTTVNRLFEQFEESMQGLDTEFGILVPALDKFADLRLFVGYYDFENTFGEDLSGMKARAELRFSSKLAVDATWYEDEQVAGDDLIFGVRMNLPIFPENLENGQSPFRGSFEGLFNGSGRASRASPHSQAATVGAMSRRLRSRMTEEVLRANRVQTSESDFIENIAEREIKRTSNTDTKVIASDIIFVNNGGAVGNGIRAGSASGNGTAERPVNGIGLGTEKLVSRLGGNGTVYVQGGGAAYVEDVSVGFDGTTTGSNNGVGVRNVVYTSSYKGIGACGGFVFGGNTARPVTNGFDIRGGSSGTVNSAEISGFQASGLAVGPHAGNAIYAENVPILTISCNVLHSTLSEIDTLRLLYDGTNTGSVNIFENHITNADGGDAVDIEVEEGAFASIQLRENVIRTTSEGSDGIDVDTDDDGELVLTLINNSITTEEFAATGVDTIVRGDSILDILMRGNTIRTNGDFSDAIELHVDEGGFLFATLEDNHITTTGSNADALDIESAAIGVIDAVLVGNTIRTFGDDSSGIDIDAEEGSFQIIDVFENSVSTRGDNSPGITGVAVDDAELDLVWIDNVVSTLDGEFSDAFGLVAVDDGIITALISGNRGTTTGEDADGLFIGSFGFFDIGVIADGNTFTTSGVDADGFGLDADGAGILIVTLATSNTISTLLGDDVFVATDPIIGALIINDNIVGPPVTGDFP